MPHAKSKDDKSTLKIVAAAMVGHILEFFDFTIYAVFAVELGKSFFPAESEFSQILASLMVLSVGFFMRPLGGLLFGHIGDKFGRKVSLIICVVGMALATFLMSIMPTYEEIGLAATLILVSLRLVQGICVGGEGAGSSVFVLEHLNKLKPGLIGGIVNAALTIGILLAILTGLVLNTYMPADSEKWRYAFAFGGCVGIIGLYLLLSVEETPIFKELKAKNQVLQLPIKDVINTNMRGMVIAIAIGAITGCSGYLVMTFIDIFYKSVMHLPAQESLIYAVYGNFLLIVFLPLMGFFSDRIGYEQMMCYGALIAIFAATPIFIMMESEIIINRYIAISALSAVVSMIYAPLYPFILKLFKPEQRYSGIAFSLNVGIAMFGGTSSMFCLSLIQLTHLNYAASIYWISICAGFLIVVLAAYRKNPFKFPIKKDRAAAYNVNA
ncbi:MAG: MFS transporter [Alphaproteobacteria bacterium]